MYCYLRYKGQNYFFCSNCDLYDTLLPLEKTPKKRNTVRYKCKANHTSCIHPTHMKNEHSLPPLVKRKKRKRHHWSKANEDSDNEISEDSSDDETIILSSSSSTCSSDDSLFTSGLLDTTNDTDLSSLSDTACLEEQLIMFMTNKSMSSHEMAQALITLVFDQDFLDGCFLDECVNRVRKYMRKNVFTCHNVLKNMDYMGGTLSYEGIELLRRVEKDYFNSPKGFKTFLPSKGSL